MIAGSMPAKGLSIKKVCRFPVQGVLLFSGFAFLIRIRSCDTPIGGEALVISHTLSPFITISVPDRFF